MATAGGAAVLGQLPERHPDDREVRRLGAATGEDDVRAPPPEDPGDPRPGGVEGLRGAPSDLMVARRIAEGSRKVRPGRLERLPANGRGGGGVEIERVHLSPPPSG